MFILHIIIVAIKVQFCLFARFVHLVYGVSWLCCCCATLLWQARIGIEDMAAIRLLNILWSAACVWGLREVLTCGAAVPRWKELFEHWSISSKLNTCAISLSLLSVSKATKKSYWLCSIFHQLVKKSSKTPFCGNFSQCGPCLTLIGRVGNRRNIMRPYFASKTTAPLHT